MKKDPIVIILNEGTRGHMGQSRGICTVIAELRKVETAELNVPVLKGKERLFRLKYQGAKLADADLKTVKKWLFSAHGEALYKQVAELVEGRDKVLLISAGSSAAPYSLALAKLFKATTCVIMKPSVPDVGDFDMAILPEHDQYKGENVLQILGAPNIISPDLLEEKEEELLLEYPALYENSLGVLIGGDDANYTISPEWIEAVMSPLLDESEAKQVDLYITSSRRTSDAAEKKLEELCEAHECVRMLLIASKDDYNPVPGILGHCENVLCTEDSVSMISEAATAGVNLTVVNINHKEGTRSCFQNATKNLIKAGLLPGTMLWGVPRFSAMRDRFVDEGLARIVDYHDVREKFALITGGYSSSTGKAFNESSRAAIWIAEKWLGKKGESKE